MAKGYWSLSFAYMIWKTKTWNSLWLNVLNLNFMQYFIPAGILLKCLMETSDREIYEKIMAGAAPGSGHAAFVSERAELLLQQASRLGLKTK